MDTRGPETSFTSAENGHKIAFDPRDLSETEERSKQPKLTLMEEVLLLGLKDKQVSIIENKGDRGVYVCRSGSLNC
jgi:Golgi phosphoprotein 3